MKSGYVDIYPATELILDPSVREAGLKKIVREGEKAEKVLRQAMKTEEAHRVKQLLEDTKDRLEEFEDPAGLDGFLDYFYPDAVSILDCFPENTVIFLDEPTAFLDFPSKVEIMQLLHHLSRSTNKTIFLSTHDLELALQIADKIWLMDKANGVTIGTPEDLSIDGCLSNFFSRKGIVFDMETGLFRIDNEFEKEVRLVGHGNKYAMVRKALQRNGILASRRVESDFYIETGDMTTNGYIIHPVAGRTIKVDTIEKLLEQVTAILASV